MQKKYFKNPIILFILIASTMLSSGFIPKKVEAQNMLESAMTTLPGCASLPIDKGIKSLFGKVGNAVDKLGLDTGDLKDIAGDFGLNIDSLKDFGVNTLKDFGLNGLSNVLSSALSQSTAIDVNLPDTTENKLNALNKNIEAVQQSTKSTNENDTCIQGIGKLVTKNLSQKLAISTVDWINTGFDGGPAFVQDTEKYFKDIAENKILKFSSEIIDPKISPFGKDSVINTATNFKNTFQDVAKYSLDDVMQVTNPGFSTASFKEDFEQGGWDAWTEMTQNPANNPLGFKILAANELQKRLTGTTQPIDQNVQSSLQASGGFLNDERCKEPKNLSKTEDAAGLLERSSNPTGPYSHSICTGGWEVVTPGKMIADAATNVMGYQNDAYLNVADMNDAVTAISDVILNQFSSNVMQKGFANLGEQGTDGSLLFSSRGSNPFKSQTEGDFTPLHLSSSWLTANPNFNIRTDLTQALIDEQRTYSIKLAEQNKEISSTTDGKPYKINNTLASKSNGTFGQSNAYGLLPVIYQLDYCIPGPHPGWEEDAIATRNKKLKNYSSEKITSLDFLSSDFISNGNYILAPTEEKKIQIENSANINSSYFTIFYRLLFFNFTGNFLLYPAPNTMSVVLEEIDKILDEYASKINKIYFSDREILPSITYEAAINFNQIKGYKQMLTNNENKIYSFKSTVNILQEIKNAVDELNKQLITSKILNADEKTIAGDQKARYEEKLKTQINAFGRLSQNMVNGDDIMAVDNLTKQIVDKRIYLYKDLLKGEYGCEAFLEKPQKPLPWPVSNLTALVPQTVNTIQRVPYPSDIPIIYDYNFLKKEDKIPDPPIFESGLGTTKRIMKSPKLEMVPTFYDIFNINDLLSFDKYSKDNNLNSFLDLTLVKNHLYTYNEDWATILDSIKNTFSTHIDPWTKSLPFERMMGIY